MLYDVTCSSQNGSGQAETVPSNDEGVILE